MEAVAARKSRHAGHLAHGAHLPTLRWPNPANRQNPYEELCMCDGEPSFERATLPMGCICPPGANLTCEAPMCPRKGMKP